MILSFIELVPRSDNREKMMELLRYSVERLASRPACLGSAVYVSDDGSERILYIERWQSLEDLSAHIQSPLYLGILYALDLALEQQINFHEVASSKSMDLIVALRSTSSVSGRHGRSGSEG